MIRVSMRWLLMTLKKGYVGHLQFGLSSVAVAIGIAVSAGFSHPELLKPSLTSSGSWRFAEGKGFEITPAFYSNDTRANSIHRISSC